MSLFKQDENDKISGIIHKIAECILFLGGTITGDYVYSMINDSIKPTLLEAYNINYSKFFDMVTNILELEYIVIPVSGNYNNKNMKIKLDSENEITVKLKLVVPIPSELVYFEHELLTLGIDGLYIRDYNGRPLTNIIKVTKMIKNYKLKALPVSHNGLCAKELFIRHVELNKALLKRKDQGWVLINPDKLRVMKYSLYDELYGGYDDICSICVESFERDKTVFVTECKHLFHTTCWMRNINSLGGSACPNCRGQVWSNNISFMTPNIETPISTNASNVLPVIPSPIVLPLPNGYDNNEVD